MYGPRKVHAEVLPEPHLEVTPCHSATFLLSSTWALSQQWRGCSLGSQDGLGLHVCLPVGGLGKLLPLASLQFSHV